MICDCYFSMNTKSGHMDAIHKAKRLFAMGSHQKRFYHSRKYCPLIILYKYQECILVKHYCKWYTPNPEI